MNFMTKEWLKEFEYLDLIVTLQPSSRKKIPFVLLNGTDCVAKEDLYTVKTDFNLSDNENDLSFVMLPDSINLGIDLLGDGINLNEKICKNDFLIQYLNNLRIISYIPKDIIKNVKDKRLLALGYADKETKTALLKYLKNRYSKAYKIYEKCCNDAVIAEQTLTVHKQLKEHFFAKSVPLLFDGVEVTRKKITNIDICLTLDNMDTVIFRGAKVIEEEADILNGIIMNIELYKRR